MTAIIAMGMPMMVVMLLMLPKTVMMVIKVKYVSLGYWDCNYRNPVYSCSRRYVHIDLESPILAKPRFSIF